MRRKEKRRSAEVLKITLITTLINLVIALINLISKLLDGK